MTEDARPPRPTGRSTERTGRTDRAGNPIEPYRQVGEGGMSREGMTTVVKISPSLDPSDELVLCSVICHCNKNPGVGKNGQSLKQACVSQKMTAHDQSKLWQSRYKAEVNYDMLTRPPSPIMSPNTPTKPHGYLPEWIKNGRPQGYPPYSPGSGMVRRPDVIIVTDPTKPPTQDNIEKVIEIKFPPDPVNEAQQNADLLIAGSDRKCALMSPEKCGCGPDRERQPDPSMRNVEDLGLRGVLAERLVRFILGSPGQDTPPDAVPAR